MARRIKNIFKKAFNAYCNGMYEMYRPCLEHGVNPFV